jgi:hypothetical protein
MLSICLFSLGAGQNRPAAAPGPGDPKAILERSRATYAALRSYADTGVIITELLNIGTTGPPLTERHTFVTYYRAPRQFLFDFKKDPKVGDERFVVWANGADFNTWWSATKVHDTYPKGRGATAFALAAFPTKNSIVQIAPLLFAQAGLHGSIVDFQVSRAGEVEVIDGHRCYQLIGQVGLAYSTGTVTDVRPTIVWIDAETLLARKVLEDTPSSAGAGTVDRITTIFEPQADPKIDDTRFSFSVPSE